MDTGVTNLSSIISSLNQYSYRYRTEHVSLIFQRVLDCDREDVSGLIQKNSKKQVNEAMLGTLLKPGMRARVQWLPGQFQ